jgi:hypothetical protein
MAGEECQNGAAKIPKVQRQADAKLAAGLARGLSVRRAAERAGISRRTAFRRLAEPHFRALVVEKRVALLNRSLGVLASAQTESFHFLKWLVKEGFAADGDDLLKYRELGCQAAKFLTKLATPPLRAKVAERPERRPVTMVVIDCDRQRLRPEPPPITATMTAAETPPLPEPPPPQSRARPEVIFHLPDPPPADPPPADPPPTPAPAPPTQLPKPPGPPLSPKPKPPPPADLWRGFFARGAAPRSMSPPPRAEDQL